MLLHRTLVQSSVVLHTSSARHQSFDLGQHRLTSTLAECLDHRPATRSTTKHSFTIKTLTQARATQLQAVQNAQLRLATQNTGSPWVDNVLAMSCSGCVLSINFVPLAAKVQICSKYPCSSAAPAGQPKRGIRVTMRVFETR